MVVSSTLQMSLSQMSYMYIKWKCLLNDFLLSIFTQLIWIVSFWWHTLCSQKTVVAVLDQMMNPHWPYLPKRKERYTTQEEMDGREYGIPFQKILWTFIFTFLSWMVMNAGDPQKLHYQENMKSQITNILTGETSHV